MFTNDYATAGYDRRHFIDYKWMLNLPHGASLEASLASPQPVCFGIIGKGMAQQTVVGMLGLPLEVKVKLNGELMLLRLEQVIVIDRLPVPLHVSMKRLEDDKSKPAYYLDDLKNAMFNRGPMRIALNTAGLPEEFHSHPYWTDDSTYIGHAGEAHAALQDHSASEAVRTGPAVTKVSCPVCGATEELMRCGRCLNVWYCCREHQVQHWKTHKQVCIGW
ncbi:hypothetical protein B484DRAFT_450548 [Ochromonadaceae sp. CCMP2298]|nr:hypothetical protein B484DRAFT_450548 [Ochromonadaceae sp. CCMP2298]|mmetsp:Transcript_12419/g.27639  ORF Transcript_12419/g.27639 Transcript_12419/m.27639 type:complete len:219 (-) Transcript_12419:110-766(-)